MSRKLSVLKKFLNTHPDEKVIVFFATCAAVDYFGRLIYLLLHHGSTTEGKKVDQARSVLMLHGKMVQKKRNIVYSEFLKTKSGVLVCTDVAARGIDVPDVYWIIQVDAPKDPNFFVHRVGRTARAGRRGAERRGAAGRGPGTGLWQPLLALGSAANQVLIRLEARGFLLRP